MVPSHFLAAILVAGASSGLEAIQHVAPVATTDQTVFALLHVDTKQDRESFESAQIILIKGRPMLKLALGRPEIADLAWLRALPDPVAWLERNLRVDFADDGTTLRVALRGTHGRDLAALVNAVTDVYLQHVQLHGNRKWKKLSAEMYAQEERVRLAHRDLQKKIAAGNEDIAARLLLEEGLVALRSRRLQLRDAEVPPSRARAAKAPGLLIGVVASPSTMPARRSSSTSSMPSSPA